MADVYEWVQNRLIYANLQSSLENKPNLMMTYDDFYVCLNGALIEDGGHIPILNVIVQ